MPPAQQPEEGRVTVCVRARPLNEREKRLNSPLCLLFQEGKTIRIYKKSIPTDSGNGRDDGGKAFTFDYAYDSETGQQTVYEDLGLPVLDASLKGFNTCLFAYGQTGSGKSYSMMGPSGGRDVFVDPGIIPQLSKGLFERVTALLSENKEEREKVSSEGVANHAIPPELSTNIIVSYMEIYQEKVNCLINAKSDNLKVREHPALGVYVEGITEVNVDSEDAILQLMNSGNQSRHMAATKMNDRSSRSHAIFAITLVQRRTGKTKEGATATTELRSRINLVDLAGSERAKSTGAEGEVLREGANINKSLTVLGLVISALADISKKLETGGSKHVPYRDSTLTFILKESLGGNSKTFMLSTLSPAAANYEETMSTLRYADRAKSIVTRAVINETAGDKRIRELEDEISRLREKMRHYEELVQKGVVRNSTARGSSPSSSGETDARAVEDEEVNYIEPQTPRQSRDAAVMEAELHRAEGLIQRLNAGEGKPLGMLDIYKSMPTVKVHRNDPFILNVDGVGDWVMEYLVADVTYLGTKMEPPSTPPSPPSWSDNTESSSASVSTSTPAPVIVENGKGEVRCIAVNGPRSAGIGPHHCCFLRTRDGHVLLRPIGANRTYIDDEREPVRVDTLLSSGAVVCVGDEYLEFRFTDPASPQMAVRRRGGRGALETSSLSPGGSTNTPPSALTPVAVVPPGIPALRLSEALQRRQGVQQQLQLQITQPHHRDPVNLTGRGTGSVSRCATARVTPRTAMTTGRMVVSPNDTVRVTYRHTFIFLGARDSGKSAFRENIRKPDKWYSIFAKDKLHVQPTFGVASSMIETSGHQEVQIHLTELSGCGCFSLLEGLLPTRRVTYVLCFSLCDPPSLQTLQPLLEIILSNTANHNASVILIGTYLDQWSEGGKQLNQLFIDMEVEVSNYFRLLQGAPEMRPSIVGRFAVDNINRVIFSPGVAKVEKFPQLLCWFGEHVIQRCRNDIDFPNAEVPLRALELAKRMRELHHDGKWCLSSGEYKTIAKAVDSRYGSSLEYLHRHTQLLHSWGILHHHYRHLSMKRHVMIDVPWVFRAVSVLSCCTPIAQGYGADGDGNSIWRPVSFLTCRAAVERMQSVLPFDGDEVLTSDVFNLLPRGILTMRTASILFRKILAEKSFTLDRLMGLLELLRSYDFIVMGSRLKFSAFLDEADRRRSGDSKDSNDRKREKEEKENGKGQDAAEDKGEEEVIEGEEEEEEEEEEVPEEEEEELEKGSQQHQGEAEEDKSKEKVETFFLIPSCFTAQAPSAFCLHVPSFLFGPFYRFTLSLVPHNFFARVISRVAQYAESVYLGPAIRRRVPTEEVVPPEHAGAAASVTAIVGHSEMWESTAWVASSNNGRALLRMVHHSFFITFHDFGEDDQFYDGIRHVVRGIVYESPGVQCEESILCARRFMEEEEKAGQEHGDKVYWRGIDENINSLEKIRLREQFALMTARGHTARNPPLLKRQDNPRGDGTKRDEEEEEEEEVIDNVIPFMRNRDEAIDEADTLRRICQDSLLTDRVLDEVKAAIRSMNDVIDEDTVESEIVRCKAMDKLVDALAQS